MPEAMLRSDLSVAGRLDVAELARKYYVSDQAMWIQLIDSKLAAQYAER